jgi:hypothetical protein
MFGFVNGVGCHYSPLHFEVHTQITLARIQDLQQYFKYHNQYYSRLIISVCINTAAHSPSTRVLLLLGVLLCCHQHSVPGLPHLVPCRTRV